MNRKYKTYLKLNVMSLFFIAISSISVTLAWFAYSGIASVATEVDVKSWLIEFEKNEKTVSNNIVISLSEIYPGMNTLHESIKIKNKGDSNAKLSASIISARILDEEYDVKNIESNDIVDKLSHDYPFSVNMSLDDTFVLSGGEESAFNISVSWPLDSDNDQLDSEWGNLAYQFGNNELKKQSEDATYQLRPSIKIIISVKAEQAMSQEEVTTNGDVSNTETYNVNEKGGSSNVKTTSDIKYPLGKLILYDIESNIRCTQLSDTCIRTHIIDVDNKVSDDIVTLLPDILSTYPSGSYDKYDELLSTIVNEWNVSTRLLGINDILKIVSKDINNSLIIIENLSDSVIGYMEYENRIENAINRVVKYNGYFSFQNTDYTYLVTNKCYWLKKEYSETEAFALTKNNEETSKIYGENKNNECSVIPVILAPKQNLNI